MDDSVQTLLRRFKGAPDEDTGRRILAAHERGQCDDGDALSVLAWCFDVNMQAALTMANGVRTERIVTLPMVKRAMEGFVAGWVYGVDGVARRFVDPPNIAEGPAPFVETVLRVVNSFNDERQAPSIEFFFYRVQWVFKPLLEFEKRQGKPQLVQRPDMKSEGWYLVTKAEATRRVIDAWRTKK